MNRKLYSPDWLDEIRPLVLKRDLYRCRKCRVRHKSYIERLSGYQYRYIERDLYLDLKSAGVKVLHVFLHVCHLDHNKDNNDFSNLISLCVVCHSRNDAERRRLLRLAR